MHSLRDGAAAGARLKPPELCLESGPDNCEAAMSVRTVWRTEASLKYEELS